MGVPSDVAVLRGVLSPGEAARAALDRVLPGPPPGEDISVGRWVGRRLGRAVVDRIVDPLLGGVYGGRADNLSLAATIPQLPRDERSAVAAARRALPPASTPAGPVFGTLTTGMGSLPVTLRSAIEAHGGGVMTGRAVRRIDRAPDGWQVVHGPTTDEQVLDADAVIVAVPAAATARLLGGVAPNVATEIAAVEAASMAIVTTAWRAADSPVLDTSGYLVPAVYRRPVKAVTFASSKWAHLGRPEVAIVRCSIGRHGELVDLQRDDVDLTAAAVAELTTYAGFRGVPVESRVSRWGGGLPQYAVGHRARVTRIQAAVAAVPGLAVCGATYDGVGLPACVRTAQAAADQVAQFLREVRASREDR
jgi:oxygen-dependent protoporphyrinogen oxidase